VIFDASTLPVSLTMSAISSLISPNSAVVNKYLNCAPKPNAA
jgi:hypothetical protein